MKPCSRVATLSALVGLASGISPTVKLQAVKVDPDDKASKNAKMGAVNKVITMMEGLRKEVDEAGKKEAEAYRKFERFCKETGATKSEAIKTGETKVATLKADIENLELNLSDLEDKIAGLLDDIDKSATEQGRAKAERAKTLSIYDKNAADVQSALDSLTDAIRKLKNSKPSLVETNSIAGVLRNVKKMADTLDVSSKKTLGFLQQAPAEAPTVAMENYKFHSKEIIQTLVKLERKFRDEKMDLDAVETKSIADFNLLIQKETDITKDLNHDLDNARKAKARTTSSIATNNEDLAATKANLADDKTYFKELNKMCTDKEKTMKQRTTAREDELTALEAAIDIVKGTVSEKTTSSTLRFAQQSVRLEVAHAVAKSPSAMEAVEAAAESAESFLQIADIPDGGRDMVATLLRNKGHDLHSNLLAALATRIATSKDPFVKVKQMIQDLIERLLNEQNKESDSKAYCDKAIGAAEQKRDYAASEVSTLNSEMEKLEARRDTLVEELKVLDTEMKDLVKSHDEADKERKEESAANKKAVEDAQAGLKAVKQAIDILEKYYKTNAKNSVNLDLVQGPLDDAPDAGFDNGEAYLGAGSESTGIIGLLEVIEGDFTRTIKETEKSEKNAEADHFEFTTQFKMSLSKKKMATDISTKQLDETKMQLGNADASFKSQMTTLKTAVKELVELQPECVDTGMTYEERVAAREEETAALKKALCVLEAYAQYGPDGTADVC